MIHPCSWHYWLPTTALIFDMKDPLHRLCSPFIDTLGRSFAFPKEKKLPIDLLPEDKSSLGQTLQLLLQKMTLAALMIFTQNRLTRAIKKSKNLPKPSGRLVIAIQSLTLIGRLWSQKKKVTWTDRVALIISLVGTSITAFTNSKMRKYTSLDFVVAAVAGALLGCIWENFSSALSQAAYTKNEHDDMINID